MKKRGQLIFKALFVIILSVFLIFFFPKIGNDYGSGEAYSKLTIAKDIALLIDTLYSYHGEINITYPCKCEKYTIKIYSDRVVVYNPAEGERDFTEGVYKFVKAYQKIIQTQIQNPRSLAFSKNDKDTRIKKIK